MGSCGSVHKYGSASVELPKSTGSNNLEVTIPSPVKPKPAVDANDFALKSQWSPGNKEESFFDSQPWLESDCEDDFFSVNGDFTPSRGNTPVHHNFSLPKLQVNKIPVVEDTKGSVEPSPLRRRLSDLFNESSRVDAENSEGDENVVIQANNINEKTPNGMPKIVQGRSVKPGECCFPVLQSRRSFNDQVNKKTHSITTAG